MVTTIEFVAQKLIAKYGDRLDLEALDLDRVAAYVETAIDDAVSEKTFEREMR